jgi:hypothetical protein
MGTAPPARQLSLYEVQPTSRNLEVEASQVTVPHASRS